MSGLIIAHLLPEVSGGPLFHPRNHHSIFQGAGDKINYFQFFSIFYSNGLILQLIIIVQSVQNNKVNATCTTTFHMLDIENKEVIKILFEYKLTKYIADNHQTNDEIIPRIFFCFFIRLLQHNV